MIITHVNCIHKSLYCLDICFDEYNYHDSLQACLMLMLLQLDRQRDRETDRQMN